LYVVVNSKVVGLVPGGSVIRGGVAFLELCRSLVQHKATYNKENWRAKSMPELARRIEKSFVLALIRPGYE
jgi:hypothetical protein